ncbi:PAS domain S-box protein [Mesorhizobium sp.]|uniref:PAS domain S-box protein n=1 Tax=Mesorhizobium sp. TaxID=1871066 RepID=UPI003BAA1AD8
MPPENYSFLDVAVLDAVRQRFAAGDAIAILSTDLEQVIWANGPGAAAFGYADIEAIIGASAHLPLVARRQIMATSGFPGIGSDRSLMVRLATGMTSRAVGFLASAVKMPDGEDAIMLAVPAAQTGSRSAAEIAARAISGFTEHGHFIAFLDAKGNIEAASDGFSALGILPETLAALVADVASGNDRIVKRLVPGGSASYPAGLAKLTDLRHLLVVIDEDQLDDEVPAGEAVDEGVDGTGADMATASGEALAQSKSGEDHEPEAPLIEAACEHADAETEQNIPAPAEQALHVSTGQHKEDAGSASGATSAQHDHWYFNAGEDDAQRAGQPDAAAPHEPPAVSGTTAESSGQDTTEAPPAPARPATREIDRSAPPLRFVWRTDAEGKFSTLSPEFSQIVGKTAADVIGRRFKDVATTFGLDASGEIAGLLERRDTWSGRSVLWPVAGTDLKIPVDLAALPVYSRSRVFEGFRGFGVARTGDAVVDPEAIGMALVPNGAGPAAAEIPTQPPEEPETEDPFKGEVPALTIVPKPERRFADKVIRLAEHRQPANDKGLSTLERSAFREIGERLKKDSAPAAQTEAEQPAVEKQPEPAAKATTTADTTQPVPDMAPREEAHPSHEVELQATAKDSGPISDEPPEVDVEDQEDLARLDGGRRDDPHAGKPGGSLLSFASHTDVPADVATAADKTPVAVADQESPRNGAEPIVTDPQQAAKAAADTADDDDSMTSADFHDAEDNEDWPDEEAGAPTNAGEIVGARPRPLLHVPPIKLEGFVPSAFSVGEETPDTSIIGKLPVPLLIHSGDTLHYANDEFLHLTGYDTVEDLSDAGGLDALFADHYAGDGTSDGADRTLRLKTRDGQEFPIEAILRSVPWRGGKALMLVVRRSGEDDAPAAPLHAVANEQTQPDISELKSRIAEMRTIIDTATDGVVLIGRDGAIRSISRPAEALFGFDSDEVTGKPFASLFAIESQRAARDYLEGLSEPGVASVLNDGREVIGREAQGRFIPLFMTIGRLPNESGFCAVVRDITQWKRAEEELTQARAVAERASSQKTDFLARISHEIRTPLNAIIGFSELMVDEKFGPVANDRYRDYLRDINRSGNHVLDLVNDLLDISKIEAGQQEMDYEAVSLNDTLAETVAMMQPQANRERVIIRSSFASRLPEVVADLRSVRQIALNILSNAIRYTQAGGQVIVSTAYETSGDVVMRVRDTGIGMSQAEIEQALKPFKQINALKRGRGDGTGLGLPLTKAMVEANRARFTINSTPGEGTLVEVAFPSTRVLAE